MYFSRKHPLVCWIISVLSVFSGTLLANFLLNEPVVSVFGNTKQVLWASGIWYLIFYSPFDIAFRLCNFLPIKLSLYCIDEIHNCKLIYHGITHSARIFEESYFVMAIVGVVKGNGPAFTRMVERILRGNWSITDSEFLYPSYSTKVSILVTLVFITNKHCESLMISQSFVSFYVVSACIYLRVSNILMDLTNPFSPFENLICLILFGGIWDAIARAFAIDEHCNTTTNVPSNLGRPMKADILFRNNRLETM